MACNCTQVIDCGNTVDIDTGSFGSMAASITHDISHQDTIDNFPASFLNKVVRKFSFNWSVDKSSSGTGYLVACGDETLACEQTYGQTSYSATVSEDCVIEKNIPYYIDRFNNIFVYKYIKESLQFNVSSSKSAEFKVKWPPAFFNKVCIPDSARTQGTEKFILVKNGIETILAEKTYEYFPFPFAAEDQPGGVWGLYGNVVDYSGVTPDTPNVGMILLAPVPPKLGQPLDNDVKHYGFYDYNSVEGGFVENSLPKDDGGKDYFYPYWCRQMPTDALWRETADIRYDAMYYKTDYSGDSSWYVPAPEVYSLPFGSFAVDSKDDFIYSLLAEFSERSGGSGFVANYSTFGDLYKAIYTDNKITSGQYSVLYPVSPL